ncbi:Short-chain dehydrogenase/reductase SDR [Candidatus Sulfotelmatobacter kueseliae]|uniref:Short-chain dehydrogenase/reductase SDR n=1 Tax=Candidatus Sulfotelmatobacter kueseliae TaxID=2042962 RepID=A0A2U3KP67_9BACT|nr:Short-chain dehydrogenase/reductase SDR [Candidatus Sulfotelmatobacter kueseliae]
MVTNAGFSPGETNRLPPHISSNTLGSRNTAGRGLRGQVALVTGATRGIGLAIARALAAEGCDLIVTGRDQAALNRISRELARRGKTAAKIRILSHPSDVRDPHSVDALFRAIRRQFRRLDILVNNAGIAQPNLPVDKLPFPVWKDVLETNLDGMFLVTQAALVLMKRGGSIVNNLSVAANRVFAGSAAYNASKHGALGLSNTLREELRPRGIRVIGVLPGAADTDIWKTLWPEAPRRKMMSPETVARAVVDSILLPANTTVEILEIRPSTGTL